MISTWGPPTLVVEHLPTFRGTFVLQSSCLKVEREIRVDYLLLCQKEMGILWRLGTFTLFDSCNGLSRRGIMSV